ncbi:hypothetical protein F2Q69_00036749 [Brassica cretica]|uniref:Uncharacterized protein n=1 Tax=Brassica cretica TaxID=69181 RepID=A0A8S9SGP4_BRACR|nr:hypothetical protein F2Q69_00036749 [Brassica cretica]
MASNGTLASPSSQSDKLQDPPPVALDSSSAPLGVELPILRGCDTDIVAPPCTEAQASQIISASHLPTVEANVTSGSTTSNQFVPSLGSWEKPLIFVPPTTPPVPSTPTEFDKALSAQAATPSMESSPSTKIINNEDQNTYVVDPSTTTSDVNVFESPSRFSALGDVDGAENESLSSLGLTRGGRETRPPIKFQDLEWKTVQGRGKHGRRGRGSKH